MSAEADRALGKSQGGNNSQGPIYKVPEALGRQLLSTNASSPLPGFGSSQRPALAQRAAAPGPGAYRSRAALGVQFDSRKASSAVMHFPSSKRDAAEKLYISAEHEKSGYGRDSPGPSAYNTSPERHASVHTHSSGIKGGPRFVDPAAKMRAGLPGPGHYAMPAAVGRQPVSTRPSTPSVGFPRAHRDAARKIFLSLAHEKSNYGNCSPGPGTAVHDGGLGHSTLSRYRSCPAWVFGSATTTSLSSVRTPGPGEYYT
ncbi:g2299 [Coccomyxa viridis]|uniref:G2299 protein n=1 Tax=Coccomyxa viridis TaxID=1274662 RepID=A0ABP1FN02_9CHLO